MRRAWAQVEAGGEDLVGIGGYHVDTRKLLSGVDEDPKQHAAECPCLAVLKEFPISEGGLGLLCLVTGHDTGKFGDEVWMRFIHGAKFGEDFSTFTEPAMGNEPAWTAKN